MENLTHHQQLPKTPNSYMHVTTPTDGRESMIVLRNGRTNSAIRAACNPKRGIPADLITRDGSVDTERLWNDLRFHPVW